jgi:hypothetical protein
MPKKKQPQPEASPQELIPKRAQIGPSALDVIRIEQAYKGIGGVVVKDAETSLFAQKLASGWKKELKRLSDERMDITRDLDNAKKKIMALYAPSQYLLEQMIAQLSIRVVAYDKQISDAAEAAQRKIDEETERKRLADLKLAEKARARGDDEKAEEFELRAETRVAPVVQQATHVYGGGRSMVDVWDWELLDESKLKREYLEAAEKKIGATVRAMHKDAEEIVGKGAIKVTSSRSLRG